MRKIFFALLLIGLFHISGYAQTSYYMLIKKIENGVPNDNISEGQFITFVDGVCYESDIHGFSVGHGRAEYKYEKDDIKVYVGQSYWGRSVFKFNSDFSRLNVVAGDNVYVLKKASPPFGVETCSLIRQNTPGTPFILLPDFPSEIEPIQESANIISDSPKGHYEVKEERCVECLGRGYNEKMLWHGGDKTSNLQTTCSFCHGRGTIKRREYVVDY